MKLPRSFDVLGNVAIVKFREGISIKEKKQIAQKLLKRNKAITTVLEKQGKVSGRLRKIITKHLAGKKTKEVLYKENGCVFRFNIDTTYFSPRLSNERKDIASVIKKGENVLVMFAGVSPFSIVIAKNSKAIRIYSNEINREANKYAKLNIELNKVKDRVELLQGDVKRVVDKIGSFANLISPPPSPTRLTRMNVINQTRSLTDKGKSTMSTPQQKNSNFSFSNLNKFSHQLVNIPKKFDVIVMPRPQLKDSFLEQAFALSKKGTRIFYYDFCGIDETDLIVEKIKKEARVARKKIKILKVKKAGEIAPYKIRVRVDFVVL